MWRMSKATNVQVLAITIDSNTLLATMWQGEKKILMLVVEHMLCPNHDPCEVD